MLMQLEYDCLGGTNNADSISNHYSRFSHITFLSATWPLPFPDPIAIREHSAITDIPSCLLKLLPL